MNRSSEWFGLAWERGFTPPVDWFSSIAIELGQPGRAMTKSPDVADGRLDGGFRGKYGDDDKDG